MDSEERLPVAIITGGSSGIGAATAERFIKENWDVVLIGRRQEMLETTAKTISGTTGKPVKKIHTISLDITSAEAVSVLNRWIKLREDISARTTCVIHSAGLYEKASILNSTEQSWYRSFETNIFAVTRLTKVFYPFLKSNKGSVVAISSTLGVRPVRDTGVYSASKAALNSWVQTFAIESAADGIRSNAICPGIVDTPIHSFHTSIHKAQEIESLGGLQPLGRIGTPTDIANMAWMLASPQASWITGTLISVDGGISLT